MSDINSGITPIDLTDADTAVWDDGDGFAATATPFKAGYATISGTRILRHRLYADEGGVATATFTGTLDEDTVWVEGGGSGRLSIYAEVRRNHADDEEPVTTTLRVALVPTGKRVPEDARRLGSKRGTHAYLLGKTTAPIHDDEDAPAAFAASDPADLTDTATE